MAKQIESVSKNIRQQHHRAFEHDPIFYWRVVFTFGIVVVVLLVGLMALDFFEKEGREE